MVLLLTRKSLGTLLKHLLKFGHPFGHLRESIPTDCFSLTGGLRWGFLAPLGLEGTIFLILGTLASIVCTRRAPMFLAQVAMFLDASFLRNFVSRGSSVLALAMFLRISILFCVSSVGSAGGSLWYSGTCTKLLNVLKISEELARIFVGSCSGSDHTDSASAQDTYVEVVPRAALPCRGQQAEYSPLPWGCCRCWADT